MIISVPFETIKKYEIASMQEIKVFHKFILNLGIECEAVLGKYFMLENRLGLDDHHNTEISNVFDFIKRVYYILLHVI